MRDTFVVYDLLPPIANSTLNGTNDWVNATAERRDGLTRVWMSRRRRTNDKWDQPIPVGVVDVMFAVGTSGTVPLVVGTEFLAAVTVKGVSSLPLALLPLGPLDGAKIGLALRLQVDRARQRPATTPPWSRN